MAIFPTSLISSKDPPLEKNIHDDPFQAPGTASNPQPSTSSSTGSAAAALRRRPTGNLSAAEVTAVGMLRSMLQANWQVEDGTPYRELYSLPSYRANCWRKVRMMRRMAKTTSLKFVEDKRFWKELYRLGSLYQNDGGRDHLFNLIGKGFESLL